RSPWSPPPLGGPGSADIRPLRARAKRARPRREATCRRRQGRSSRCQIRHLVAQVRRLYDRSPMAIRWRDSDFDLDVPAELEAGVYASFLATWYTAHEFTLDFGTPVADDPERQLRGVARVKVPPGVVFDMIRIIHARMTQYEEKH